MTNLITYAYIDFPFLFKSLWSLFWFLRLPQIVPQQTFVWGSASRKHTLWQFFSSSLVMHPSIFSLVHCPLMASFLLNITTSLLYITSTIFLWALLISEFPCVSSLNQIHSVNPDLDQAFSYSCILGAERCWIKSESRELTPSWWAPLWLATSILPLISSSSMSPDHFS